MISVEEAISRITGAFTLAGTETISIAQAVGRVAADDVRARIDQPPAPVSAMDGYAVRAEDAAQVPVTLKVIGSSPAGHPFKGKIGAGETVRIFTGGVVPEGADAVVIQENTQANADRVVLKEGAQAGRHIRKAGLDFARGDVLVKAGKRITARDAGLIAAGDIAEIEVRRRPRVALAATGDELTLPGAPKKPGAIVASSGYALRPLIELWGGEVLDLGIVPDTAEAVAALPKRAAGADLLVTLGGASVGEHDLIQKALGPEGFTLDFWKIAMRPGKPLIFGRLGDLPLMGLPGNPVSTLVCALLYLRPAIAALLGTETAAPLKAVRLSMPLKANDSRQDYVRAMLEIRDGEAWAMPLPIQDSSMLSILARADCLIVRPPHAPAAEPGERVGVFPLDAA
jgi:molybdopterin molybdotransferase